MCSAIAAVLITTLLFSAMSFLLCATTFWIPEGEKPSRVMIGMRRVTFVVALPALAFWFTLRAALWVIGAGGKTNGADDV